MELGSNFAAKLEPFLLMAKSLKGAAAAKLIQDATSAPGVFVFVELLELANIQELKNSELHAQFYTLLQLFSYKTYQDYIQHKDVLPPLNPAQIMKLKHLSIVSLATDRRILPYQYLLQTLDMPTIRELEDLIIDAIYLDIFRGKLDQKEQQLEVEYTMGRDLEPGKVENLLGALKDWAATTSAVLSTLDQELSSISSQSTAMKAYHDDHERVLNANLKDVMERQKEKGGVGMVRRGYSGSQGISGSVAGDKDSMDVDEPTDNSKGKNRKAPQESTTRRGPKRNKF